MIRLFYSSGVLSGRAVQRAQEANHSGTVCTVALTSVRATLFLVAPLVLTGTGVHGVLAQTHATE